MEDLEVLLINFDAKVLFPMKVWYRRFKRSNQPIVLGIIILILIVIVRILCFISEL